MEINYKNLQKFITQYPIKKTDCEHDFPKEFEEIGSLLDKSYGFLSYSHFRTNNKNEIFIGSYPYNSAKLWKCKKCNCLTFSYSDDSGWGRLTKIKVDFEKDYLAEPANKQVNIKRENLEKFVEKFGFKELLSPETVPDNSEVRLIDKSKKYVFGFSKIKTQEKGDTCTFTVVANRKSLRAINEFEKEN